MSTFDRPEGGDRAQGPIIPGSLLVIKAMRIHADIAMQQSDYKRAFQIYQDIVGLHPDLTAQYNLGTLYAQGKGTEQSFYEGAYWFHQAELSGDEKAGKLRLKCTMDYVHQNLDQKTPRMVFDEMLHLALHLHPRKNGVAIASDRICDIASHHVSKHEYAVAAKLYRAAAEYGNHGLSQNYLAVLYNAGYGVEKDDQASLYWFDRAVDNGVEVARRDREGMFNAYRDNFSPEAFFDVMTTLSRRCTFGDDDIPRDAEKAAYWRKVSEGVYHRDA